MNVYFFTTEERIDNDTNISVLRNLQKAGCTMYSNLEGLAKVGGMPKEMDALLVFGGKDHRELAYVLALAIARGKPVLYLLKKGVKAPPEVKKLKESKEVRKILTIKGFTRKTLDKTMKDFLDTVITGGDAYIIKFTLRLNKRLSRYLDWKSKHAKMTKAIFLRKVIEEYRDKDEKYEG